MFINIIDSRRKIVAGCDKELIGKVFEEGDFQLDVKENFYKGVEASKEDVIKILEDMKKEDATFNLVGNRIVDAAIECGVLKEENAGEIDGVKFGLILI